MDKGKTWEEFGIDEYNSFPRQLNPLFLSKPYEIAVTWIDMALTPGSASSRNWEIFFKRSLNGGTTWKNLNRLTYDAGYSDRPKLAWSGEDLMTIWADRDRSGAPWELQYRISQNKGKNWGAVRTIPTGTSACEPAVIWNPTKGKFFVIWTDYQLGFPDLRISTSKNGEGWTPPTEIANNSNNAFRRNPQVGCTEDGSLHIVWEELDPITRDWVIGTATLN